MTAKSVYVSYSRKVDEITPLVDELGEICVAYGLDFRIDVMSHGILLALSWMNWAIMTILF
jgi:hypothetical protein